MCVKHKLNPFPFAEVVGTCTGCIHFGPPCMCSTISNPLLSSISKVNNAHQKLQEGGHCRHQNPKRILLSSQLNLLLLNLIRAKRRLTLSQGSPAVYVLVAQIF